MTTAEGVAELLPAAENVAPSMVDIRRRIHRHPEIGLQLPVTQALVVDELRALGLEPRLGANVTSVTAVLEGARPGPAVVLRADMDALPLTEETGFDFASEVDGAMHACGHDLHVAMLLGAARLLLDRRDALAGSVLLMLQPGEEGYHGARSMLDEGLLDAAGTPVTGAFAIHVSTRYETKTVNTRPGPLMAAGDTIHITVRGRGGHASTPHLAADPIPVAAEIILALQAMVGRRVHAFDPAVVTIARVAAGTTTNVIPETALVEGTMRTVSEETREAVRGFVRQVAEGVSAAHGMTAEVRLVPGYPVTVNDSAFTAFVEGVAADLLGPDRVRLMAAPVMGSEDFSYVLQRVPGALASLGTCPPGIDPHEAAQNHSNRVVHDEDAMPVGAALHAAVALRHLRG